MLFIFGTRPEAIKLAPLINQMKLEPFEVKVLVTAQHRQMLDKVLEFFQIVPDYDLNLMQSNQDLTDITIKVLSGCREILKSLKPDLVFVHGDTTTTFAASLAAFYEKIDVAHVEAGLRTYNINSPFPEEINRQFTSKLAKFHFAPTENCRKNLLNENYPSESILVTGNTVVDAMKFALRSINEDAALKNNLLQRIKSLIPNYGERKFILITGHRRENFGKGFQQICEAITKLAHKYSEIDFIYPVHLNPNVKIPVTKALEGLKNVHLVEPLDYLPFVILLSDCFLILTDSGGIQEEAPSLKKPVLVMRETTERPEALETGSIKLVGTSCDDIFKEVSLLVDHSENYARMVQSENPYGDGKASERIIEFLKGHC